MKGGTERREDREQGGRLKLRFLEQRASWETRSEHHKPPPHPSDPSPHPPENTGPRSGGVNANRAPSVYYREKTIHANLPPQTGVLLGQSGGESSGVERAQRSPDQGPDCSRVIYSLRTMMAAWVSTDEEPVTDPAPTAQTHLTFMH
ncbi:hypothetical protein EYF80_038977 [Liparis tanakae]|uniref:Uncharacterized protein n=1 Tax=Liparis tanakae TaxID=230148 RepID=A0A4Z2GC49_9TELE|nr:hypothetical protein EYF80_038977 [Liparis tanakae]